MITCGLDLSTSVCGYAFVENKKILDMGFLDISKADTYKEKAEIITNVLDHKTFDVINIEETLAGFGFGHTSQQTILKLAKNKAVICYILEEKYKVPVNCINASTMRKQLFGMARQKNVNAKLFVKNNLESIFDMTPWIKTNSRGNVDKKMEDAYDALVAACYEK